MDEETEPMTAVVDDDHNQRFVYRDDGGDAELLYRVDNDRLILVHAEVSESLRGRGIGGRLVRAAVERAVRTGEIVLPWCRFVHKWLGDHPDVAATITIDWSERPAREDRRRSGFRASPTPPVASDRATGEGHELDQRGSAGRRDDRGSRPRRSDSSTLPPGVA